MTSSGLEIIEVKDDRLDPDLIEVENNKRCRHQS